MPSPTVTPVNISTTNLFCAYSVNRRIASGYTGNLIRGTLFNNGTISTLDIGQSSGILDVSVIPTNAFFVPTQIFDQSGSNNHLILDRQQSINSQHGLNYISSKYAIASNQVCFSLTNNWADTSNICVYTDGDSIWGRGQDGFGTWSWAFAPDTYLTITASPNQAYATSLTPSQERLGFTDFSNTTQGIITASQNLTTSIPNNQFRNSTVGVLSNFITGTLYNGYFSEFVVYNSALNSTDRQSLFDTLSA
jgi:hypothetical protein